ncbi:MAG: hypothetical protein ACLGIV_02240 [Actinomycetes bacterium]
MTRRSLTPLAVLSSAAAGAAVLGATLPAAADGHPPFEVLATYPVAGEVAEIVAVAPSGSLLAYTDSAAEAVGFVDLADPASPAAAGTVPVGGEPTSVAFARGGTLALVAVDTSESFTDPSGDLVVVDVRRNETVTVLPLGGQPDAVAVEGRYAAVALENQRDEDIEVDGVEGGLPQAPAGALAVVDLAGQPGGWTVDAVDLTGLDGAAFPEDPEPEFVDIRRGVAAVTLQENNAVALVDLATRSVVGSFGAGEVVRDDADLEDDGQVSFTQRLVAPREPDAVQWTAAGNLVTADEGDLAAEPSGGRGWTVFSPEGKVLYADGSRAERALADVNRYPDRRSDDKGAELEGVEVASFRGTQHAFIGSERGDAVLVYDLSDESAPVLLQVLPTGDAPEGLLAVPSRGLLLASNEDDGTISVFGLTR